MGILKRQNPIEQDVTDEEVYKILDKVSESFGPDWIQCKGDHPLQRLWKRKDWLSTIELYTLGKALDRLQSAYPAWVHHQVELAKSDDLNARKGAFFELIGVSMLSTTDGTCAVPTLPDAPGIDCSLKFGPRTFLRLNLKCFGFTATHIDFLAKMNGINQLLREELDKRRFKPVTVMAFSEGVYPSDEQWAQLEDAIRSLPPACPDEPICLKNYQYWDLILAPLSLQQYELASDRLSYTFQGSCTYHRNEVRNIRSKLESGFSDLRKAARDDGIEYSDVLFVRIPVSVSLTSVQEVAEQLFNDYVFEHVTGVLLYQPDVAFTKLGGNRALHHCIRFIRNPKSEDCSKYRIFDKLHMSIPIGIITQEPVSTALTNGSDVHHLSSCYFFQKGEIFAKAMLDETTSKETFSWKGHIPGVKVHGVFSRLLERSVSLSLIDSDELLVLQESRVE